MQTTLRKVGGSIMFAVPPALLQTLNLSSGSEVDIELDEDRLIVKAHARPKYTLEALLSQCDPEADYIPDREWLDSAPVGRELL